MAGTGHVAASYCGIRVAGIDDEAKGPADVAAECGVVADDGKTGGSRSFGGHGEVWSVW